MPPGEVDCVGGRIENLKPITKISLSIRNDSLIGSAKLGDDGFGAVEEAPGVGDAIVVRIGVERVGDGLKIVPNAVAIGIETPGGEAEVMGIDGVEDEGAALVIAGRRMGRCGGVDSGNGIIEKGKVGLLDERQG